MSSQVARRRQLEDALTAGDLDAALLTDRASVRYLSGFTGSSGVLWVSPAGAPVLITDSRYDEQAKAEVGPGTRVHIAQRGWISGLEAVPVEADLVLGLESESVTLADYGRLQEALPGIRLQGTSDLVGALRRIKDGGEIEAIERAVAVAETALERTLGGIDWTTGPTELEIAVRLETELRAGGSEALPFEVIVATGPRTALPHATPTDRPAGVGELLLIDFGARIDGYCSDITRTFVLGTPEPWQISIHEQVLEAQEAARAVVGPGVSCRSVDAAARKALAAHTVDKHFGHSTGHGIGLEVHEGPSLSSRSEDTLVAGHVVTVEPGVYLPRRGGVRIEDDVLVGEGEARTLTSLPRALVQL